ncbi:MarR family winged helix-turn-helix transcriptional regulator [Cellulomonas sp. P22]|uniref:MarR family winged helix-turn-helix transcriptional regulator n=1 Tax=Cellulomonas sp. P22 TaxID=3373189 RepID=UPI0037ADCA6B
MSTDESTDLTYRTLLAAIERLARVQREVGSHIAREAGLTRAALGMVRILERCGELPISEIATHLRVDLSVASRQVSALVDAGLVDRAPSDQPGCDRRVRTVRLTAAGHELARTSVRTLDRQAAEAFAGWTADEIVAATEAVDRIAAAVGSTPHPHASCRRLAAPTQDTTTDPAAAPSTT